MRTYHCTKHNTDTVGRAFWEEMSAQNMDGNCHYRIIRMGRGLVVLPDTDRTKEATEGEVIKALGLRNKAEPMPAETEGKRTNYAISREGEFWGVIGLTQAQERFLRYIERNELFWDEVRFDAVKTEVENI